MKLFKNISIVVLTAFLVLVFAAFQNKQNKDLWEHKDGSSTTELMFGTIVKAPTFLGDLTGNVTGNISGNISGNVTGNVTGNLTGAVIGSTGSFSGAITGSASSRGVKQWGTTVSNPDTLVITGLGADSTIAVLVKIRYQLSADTTGSRNIYVATNIDKHDTAFVYQTSTSSLRRVTYDWMAIH